MSKELKAFMNKGWSYPISGNGDGEISWNNVKSKPFYDSRQRIEWNGVTDDLPTVNGGVNYWSKVSDTVPTLEEIQSENVEIIKYQKRYGPSPAPLGTVRKFDGGYSIGSSGLDNGVLAVVITKVPVTVTMFVYTMTYEETGLYLWRGSKSSGNYIQSISWGELKNLPDEYIPSSVPVIQTATVGQTIAVKAVDADGKPTEWEAVDAGGSGEVSWNDLTDKPELFSGSWNDLTDKPDGTGSASEVTWADVVDKPVITEELRNSTNVYNDDLTGWSRIDGDIHFMSVSNDNIPQANVGDEIVMEIDGQVYSGIIKSSTYELWGSRYMYAGNPAICSETEPYGEPTDDNFFVKLGADYYNFGCDVYLSSSYNYSHNTKISIISADTREVLDPSYVSNTIQRVGEPVYISSPNGTRYQITVSDDGTLTATAVT